MLPPAVCSLVDSFDGPQTLFSFSVDIFVDGQPPCSSIRPGLFIASSRAGLLLSVDIVVDHLQTPFWANLG